MGLEELQMNENASSPAMSFSQITSSYKTRSLLKGRRPWETII